MSPVKHFLTLFDLTATELSTLIERAIELKALQHSSTPHKVLEGKTLAMLFEKSSTRTRVSFEVGMSQLGGAALFLSPDDTQIGRGEPIEDTAKVISSMVDGVMIRTHEHAKLIKFAENSRVPVINGLTDDYHPCQLLADMQTLQELRGSLQGAVIAWVGDGNNMCLSYIHAAAIFGFKLHIATPKNYRPDMSLALGSTSNVTQFDNPKDAVEAADVVVTDTWASMGKEDEKNAREAAFADYCVDSALISLADKNAIFLHCLPAYRGSEVSAAVIDGPQSAVWQEAENRLHAQKALLEKLLSS